MGDDKVSESVSDKIYPTHYAHGIGVFCLIVLMLTILTGSIVIKIVMKDMGKIVRWLTMCESWSITWDEQGIPRYIFGQLSLVPDWHWWSWVMNVTPVSCIYAFDGVLSLNATFVIGLITVLWKSDMDLLFLNPAAIIMAWRWLIGTMLWFIVDFSRCALQRQLVMSTLYPLHWQLRINDANLVVSGGIGCCQQDSFECQQWRHSWQHLTISVWVYPSSPVTMFTITVGNI